jgi:hypothetical protein
MGNFRNRALPVLLLLLAAAVPFACSDSSDGSTAPARQAMLSVRMTDAPADEVSQLNVYITGLKVKPAGSPVERFANEIGGVDLLLLRGTTRELALAGVAPGRYEFIEVELDESRSSIVEKASGTTRGLRIASDKIKVVGGFDVPADASTIVTLDFDAAASLRHLGNDDWLLTPVIAQVSATSN